MAKQGKAERAKQQREIEARRRAENAARTRRGLYVRAGVALAVALGVAVTLFFALRPVGSANGAAVSAALGPSSPAHPSTLTGNFKRVSGPAPRVDGKPAVLFVGAQYCPFCAAERWALVKALSRFGQFTGLRSSTNQAGSGGFSLVPTFDLTKAGYSSPDIVFDHKDTEDRAGNPLQTLSGREQSWFNRYDSQGSIPLVVIGQYAMVGSGYDPGAIDGRSFASVQAGLQRGSGPYVHDINAEANVLTALVCRADGNRPVHVCASGSVAGIERRLG